MTARYETMESMAVDLLESWGMKRSYLDSEWSTLSGGEAQRVQLAMALASRPRILLLDECTSALDMEMKIRVEQRIVAYCRMYDVGALWITHDVDQMERLRKA